MEGIKRLPSRISASQVGLWLDCPWKYAMKYLKKMPAPFTPACFTAGSKVHNLIAKLDFNSPECLNLTDAEKLKVLRAQKFLKRYPTLPETERKMEGVVEGFPTIGYADALWHTEAHCIDWKSGKYFAPAQLKYEVQAYFYYNLYEQVYGKKLNDFYLVFLGTDHVKEIRWDTIEAKCAYVMKNFKYALSTIDLEKGTLSAADFPLSMDKGKCKRCEYISVCGLASKNEQKVKSECGMTFAAVPVIEVEAQKIVEKPKPVVNSFREMMGL